MMMIIIRERGTTDRNVALQSKASMILPPTARPMTAPPEKTGSNDSLSRC